MNDIKDEKHRDLREKIKQINWKIFCSDWCIEGIILNPYEFCSNRNPLYKHKEWLRRIYYDNDLDLSMRKICKICKIGMTKLATYFDRFGIERKKNKIVMKDGYLVKNMPEEYKHPEIKNKYIVRSLHILVMEEYINQHRNLGIGTRGITKDRIIKGKNNDIDYFFVKIGYEVHHINYNKSDSRLDNLWLFSKREHSGMRATLYNCLEILIKLNQIYFVQGMYLFNNKIDCKILNSVQKK
ncbi:MAG: HNH endonuclease [Promethearchaeota archaeon]